MVNHPDGQAASEDKLGTYSILPARSAGPLRLGIEAQARQDSRGDRLNPGPKRWEVGGVQAV